MSCSEAQIHPVYNTILEEHGSILDVHSRHERRKSVIDRIRKMQNTGTVVFFCRSRGHGFIRPDAVEGEEIPAKGSADEHDKDIFLHVSDIDSDFVPRSGDRVSYQLLPMPPKFEKFQAAHVHVINLAEDKPHKFWSTPQTKEEVLKDTEMAEKIESVTPAAVGDI